MTAPERAELLRIAAEDAIHYGPFRTAARIRAFLARTPTEDTPHAPPPAAPRPAAYPLPDVPC